MQHRKLPPFVQLPNRQHYHPLNSRQPKGNLQREQEVEDTMLDLLQPFTEGLEERGVSSSLRQLGVTLRMKLSKNSLMMRNFPRLPPDTLANDTKSKKGIIGSQPREDQHVSTPPSERPQL